MGDRIYPPKNVPIIPDIGRIKTNTRISSVNTSSTGIKRVNATDVPSGKITLLKMDVRMNQKMIYKT